MNTVTGTIPTASFEANVDGTAMEFEIVSATSVDQTYVYEPSPRPDGAFNVLYRNDKLGYGSENTGFFFFFKQGTLNDQSFNIADRLSNRIVNVNIQGINEEDVWVFQQRDGILSEWRKVDNIFCLLYTSDAADE